MGRRIGRWLLAGCVAMAMVPFAGATGLADLVRVGDRKAVIEALASGTDVNAPADDGTTALLWAIYKVDHALVDQLLARGAKPDVRNVLGATALTEAIDIGDARFVEALLKAGADPDLGNGDGQTPLMLAARQGSLPVVEMLIKAGAKVNARESWRQQTALMWAVAAGNADVADLLIRHKAEVDIRAASNDWGNQITSEPRAQYRATGGHTPLLIAARSGCTACVKRLLEAGASIDRPTPDGVTALMVAIDNSHDDVAMLLLDRGANPHLTDWWGRSALYVAIDMHSRGGGPRGGALAGANRPFSDSLPDVRATDATAPAGQAGPLQVARRLLEMGVDPDTQLNMHRPGRGGNTARFTDDLLTTGATPLLRAAVAVDRPAVELLLEHGASVDLPNVMGVTPLMAASGIGFGAGSAASGIQPLGPDPQANALAVVGSLLKAGADPNARITDTKSHTAWIARPSSMTDRQGQTALFGTISRNWVQVAKLLLDHGARTDIKDDAGKTLRDALEGKAGGRDSAATPEMIKLIGNAPGA
jgi:uncharacterized protein